MGKDHSLTQSPCVRETGEPNTPPVRLAWPERSRQYTPRSSPRCSLITGQTQARPPPLLPDSTLLAPLHAAASSQGRPRSGHYLSSQAPAARRIPWRARPEPLLWMTTLLKKPPSPLTGPAEDIPHSTQGSRCS